MDAVLDRTGRGFEFQVDPKTLARQSTFRGGHSSLLIERSKPEKFVALDANRRLRYALHRIARRQKLVFLRCRLGNSVTVARLALNQLV